MASTPAHASLNRRAVLAVPLLGLAGLPAQAAPLSIRMLGVF